MSCIAVDCVSTLFVSSVPLHRHCHQYPDGYSVCPMSFVQQFNGLRKTKLGQSFGACICALSTYAETEYLCDICSQRYWFLAQGKLYSHFLFFGSIVKFEFVHNAYNVCIGGGGEKKKKKNYKNFSSSPLHFALQPAEQQKF